MLPDASNDDDDVVEVEEDGAVKTEQGEEQSYDYSNDGTDVRSQNAKSNVEQ